MAAVAGIGWYIWKKKSAATTGAVVGTSSFDLQLPSGKRTANYAESLPGNLRLTLYRSLIGVAQRRYPASVGSKPKDRRRHHDQA